MSSRFEREIQQLECLINYNSFPLIVREGRGVVGIQLSLCEIAFFNLSLVVDLLKGQIVFFLGLKVFWLV